MFVYLQEQNEKKKPFDLYPLFPVVNIVLLLARVRGKYCADIDRSKV
jgi:hypothetical protein